MKITIAGQDSSSDRELVMWKAFGESRVVLSCTDGSPEERWHIYVDLDELRVAVETMQALQRVR